MKAGVTKFELPENRADRLKPKHDEVWCIQPLGQHLHRHDSENDSQSDVIRPKHGSEKGKAGIPLSRHSSNHAFFEQGRHKNAAGRNHRYKKKFQKPIKSEAMCIQCCAGKTKQADRDKEENQKPEGCGNNSKPSTLWCVWQKRKSPVQHHPQNPNNRQHDDHSTH